MRARAGVTNSIQACRGCKGAIWLEGDGVDAPAMPLLLQKAVAGLQVPQAPGLVEAGCAEMVTHRVDGHPAQPVCVPQIPMQFLPCKDVPKTQSA
jgi:hypothetical protein